MKNLAHIFKKFEFGAPVVAAVLVVALTGVTVLAGPGAAPPAGAVNAKFNSVDITSSWKSSAILADQSQGLWVQAPDVPGPLGQYGIYSEGKAGTAGFFFGSGPIVLHAATVGMGKTAILAFAPGGTALQADGNVSVSGHVKADGGFGDYQIVSLTGMDAPTGAMASVSMACPMGYMPLSCSFSSPSQWDIMALLPQGTNCGFTGINAGPMAKATVWAMCYNSNI